MVHTILKTYLKLVIASLILWVGTNAWAEPQPITPGQVVQGYLDTADPMFADTGTYYDEWIFTGTAGNTYLITVYSEQFPTQALLLNSITGETE